MEGEVEEVEGHEKEGKNDTVKEWEAEEEMKGR